MTSEKATSQDPALSQDDDTIGEDEEIFESSVDSQSPPQTTGSDENQTQTCVHCRKNISIVFFVTLRPVSPDSPCVARCIVCRARAVLFKGLLPKSSEGTTMDSAAAAALKKCSESAVDMIQKWIENSKNLIGIEVGEQQAIEVQAAVGIDHVATQLNEASEQLEDGDLKVEVAQNQQATTVNASSDAKESAGIEAEPSKTKRRKREHDPMSTLRANSFTANADPSTSGPNTFSRPPSTRGESYAYHSDGLKKSVRDLIALAKIPLAAAQKVQDIFGDKSALITKKFELKQKIRKFEDKKARLENALEKDKRLLTEKYEKDERLLQLKFERERDEADDDVRELTDSLDAVHKKIDQIEERAWVGTLDVDIWTQKFEDGVKGTRNALVGLDRFSEAEVDD